MQGADAKHTAHTTQNGKPMLNGAQHNEGYNSCKITTVTNPRAAVMMPE